MNYPDLLPFSFMDSLGFLAIPLFLLVLVWVFVIKGIALWKSARNGHKGWFIALLVINTLGLLELVYIIWFSKKDAALDEGSRTSSEE